MLYCKVEKSKLHAACYSIPIKTGKHNLCMCIYDCIRLLNKNIVEGYTRWVTMISAQWGGVGGDSFHFPYRCIDGIVPLVTVSAY